MACIIAVFGSRNETLYFANMLGSLGHKITIVNTPKDAGQACGISVRFDAGAFMIAKKCLAGRPFRSFVGFFQIEESRADRKATRIG